MGLLKKIGKAVKGVVKGVGKVFKPIVKTVGKILSSKIGKLIMIAAAVYTGGMALSAGWGAFTTSAASGTSSFFGSVVQGAKAFGTALTGGGTAAKAATTAASAPGALAPLAAGASQGAALNTTAAITAGTAAPAIAAAAPLAAPVGAIGKLVDVGKKIGGGVLDYAKSKSGGTIIAQALQGAAQGKALEQQQKNFEMLSGPMNADAYNEINAKASTPETPEGFLARGRKVDQALTRPRYAEVSGNPDDVYGSYVTGAVPAGG